MKKKKMSAIVLMKTVFAFVIISFTICNCGSRSGNSANNSNDLFKDFAHYQRDQSSGFNYQIFVYLTNASPQLMEEHAKTHKWSQNETVMVCYFNSNEGLDSCAINTAINVDAALDEIWKPSLVARYMHWPTGKEEFVIDPYVE